ncbi:alcohol dehydrogenase, partial [filamentous cyanobacterium CCP5]
FTWVIPLPDELPSATAGPLFCGGVTVFNPIVQLDIKPTDRVGVVGIGGLGHMALSFLHAWGCDVTAFTSSPEKATEARELGANHVVISTDSEALAEVANSFDVIISTVNVSLDWPAYIAALRPRGRLHLVGAVLEPLELAVFPLLVGQKSVSSSPTGSPVIIDNMLKFAARHSIEPITETYPFDQVNAAMDRLRNGKPRYRVVLKR